MAIDQARFAQECVRQGVYIGINPHYLSGAAKLRSGISDENQGDLIGPFRLKQDVWNANCKDTDFELDYEPDDINRWRAQCAVYALMAFRAFEAFVENNGSNPGALQLYLQQWPDAQSSTLQADLQKALDDTAALLEPAAQAVLDDPSIVPSAITEAGTPGTQAGAVPGAPAQGGAGSGAAAPGGTGSAGARPGGAGAGAAVPAAGPVPKRLVKLREANQNRWVNMQITGSLQQINNTATRLVAAAAKARYQGVSAKTRVPWFIIAVIHEREASQRWNANIAQGDPFDRVSTHVPKGRGPFASWEDAAFDALVNCDPKAAKWQDWSPGGALTLLELYNGLGYYFRGLPSPYNWASTNQYARGKFVRDGVFDPNFVDPQLGCAALLFRMKAIDASINL